MQFASIENAYDANLGIDEIVNAQLQFLATHNVSLSYGDLCVYPVRAIHVRFF